ncbi:hypothetical protein MLM_0195 [Mycobacterium lepraemurium]|nr:hypothetical protein MLM_0195 [Mycobacterium lepraemurium]
MGPSTHSVTARPARGSRRPGARRRRGRVRGWSAQLWWASCPAARRCGGCRPSPGGPAVRPARAPPPRRRHRDPAATPAAPRHVQQRDTQRMRDDVVHFPGDAPPLVGGGVLGQHLLRLDLFGRQQPLGAHQVAQQPGHHDEPQVQHDRIEAVQRGRRRGGQQAAHHRGQRRGDEDHQDQQGRREIGANGRGRAEQRQRGRRRPGCPQRPRGHFHVEDEERHRGRQRDGECGQRHGQVGRGPLQRPDDAAEQQGRIDGDQRRPDSELDDFWAELAPATIEEMLGEWKGGEFRTGHKMNGQLEKAGWFGKTFKSARCTAAGLPGRRREQVLQRRAGQGGGQPVAGGVPRGGHRDHGLRRAAGARSLQEDRRQRRDGHHERQGRARQRQVLLHSILPRAGLGPSPSVHWPRKTRRISR